MFDPTKIAALKTLGFSDDDIAGLQAQAAATEKAATDQGVAYKADEPADLPDIIVNGVTYKAFPAKAMADTGVTAPVVEEDKADAEDPAETMDEGGMEEPGEGGLTLSPEDLSAIGDAVAQALQSALGPLVGAMDLTNKVGAHMEDLKSMLGGYTAKKDSETAETRETVAALQQQLKELTGDQPAKPYRASESKSSAIITDARLLEAAQKAAGAGAGPFDDIIQGLGLARPQ